MSTPEETFPTEWEITGAPDVARRYRPIRVQPELLAAIFGGGTSASRAVEPVPDLRIIGVRRQMWSGDIEFLCQADSWEPVDPSMTPPHWTPTFTREAPPAANAAVEAAS